MPVTNDQRFAKAFRDPKNSTLTPLASGATYTGTLTENNHAMVNVSGISSTPGTVGIFFSIDDGENFDSIINFQVAAGVPFYKTLVKGHRACKVEFTNHGAAQTVFRLQTDFGDFNSPVGISTGGMLVELSGPLSETPTGQQVFPVYDKEAEGSHDTLVAILEEIRVLNMHMEQITGAHFTKENL